MGVLAHLIKNAFYVCQQTIKNSICLEIFQMVNSFQNVCSIVLMATLKMLMENVNNVNQTVYCKFYLFFLTFFKRC